MKNRDKKSAEIRTLRPDLPGTAHGAGKTPSPPAHLGKEARGWWIKICEEYAIDDEAGMLLLQIALESFDRMRGAQRVIRREGQSVRDRFGQQKAHPLLVVERDARSAMLAALKALNLDVEPLGAPGRPAGR